jgi:hypothetical protein
MNRAYDKQMILDWLHHGLPSPVTLMLEDKRIGNVCLKTTRNMAQTGTRSVEIESQNEKID